MQSCMNSQLRFHSETLPAFVAFERFLSAVNSQVYGKLALDREFFPAFDTLVTFDGSLSTSVLEKLPSSVVNLTTFVIIVTTVLIG